MSASLLRIWNLSFSTQGPGRLWLAPAVGFGADSPQTDFSVPLSFDAGAYDALKLGFVSPAAKSGGAIALSFVDQDDAGNIFETLTLGAPTDIGSAAQAGLLVVGRQVSSEAPSALVQLWRRPLIRTAVALDVSGAPVTWSGRITLWGLS